MTKNAKPKLAKIQLGVTAELVARLIKTGRKTAKTDLYAGLKAAQVATAIEADAQSLLAKAETALAKAAGNETNRANIVIHLLDNARSLNFKTTFKPAKEDAKPAAKPKAKAAAKPAPAKKPAVKAKAKPAAKPAAKVAKVLKKIKPKATA